ncbi:MAG TPA: N-methyl-L-tryptophan oxidase [Acidimicrobiales bacterium]|nr:N-methyl-L-tryptophan oxidase [Acidimicrobiales bacterium]
MPTHCDVVVVGLGAVGSAVTYQLAKAGATVVGIDQFAPPHPHGSSHGETRITRLAVAEGAAYVPFVRRSHELWREVEAETGRELLVTCGGLILGKATSTGQHGVEDFTTTTIELAAANGIDHEVLPADEVRRRFGVFHVTDEVGYFEPTAGYLRAEACVAGQLELAARLGATVRRDERVVGWSATDTGVRVETPVDRYLADRLVLAGGPWMPELAPVLSPHLAVHRQVQYWFAVAAHPERFAALPVFIWLHGATPGAYLYGFPAIDGPSGGVKVATETFEHATTPELVDRDVRDDEVAAMFDAHVREQLPDLSPTCLRHAVCLYTTAPDFGFLVDVLPAHPNVVVASPCSGHGFKHAAAIGEAVAAMALGGTPVLDCSGFSLDRLRSPHAGAAGP